MNAQDWIEQADVGSRIIDVKYYSVDATTNSRNELIGHGKALVVDPSERIAVALGRIGDEQRTHIYGGEVIGYREIHPEATEYMVESVAFIGNREAEKLPVPPEKA